ncbi:hypothetical protein MJC1_01522 [Methylocystis sp. MJC1]|jgi:hypothetical protein|nr:hypothetical protein MJC1_01522 [Methylocystis sp. MJC1]
MQCESVEFPQKALLGARQHSFEPASRQKRAVAALRAKTFDQRLIVERADNVADTNVPWVPSQSNATLRAADALDKSGGGKLLEHLRHVVSRDLEMVGNRSRAQDVGPAVGEQDEGA